MELLTAQEVCDILKASQYFVYKNRELLGGFKLGGIIRFNREVFFKKLTEVSNGDLLEKRQEVLPIRLHVEGTEDNGRQLQDRAGREKCGSGCQKEYKKDKYGFFKAHQRKA
jgi:hypothetical protein